MMALFRLVVDFVVLTVAYLAVAWFVRSKLRKRLEREWNLANPGAVPRSRGRHLSMKELTGLRSYARKLMTGPIRSGGGAFLYCPVTEHNLPYDLREPVRRREPEPVALRGHHEAANHRKGGLSAQVAPRPAGPAANGGEPAPGGVRGPDVPAAPGGEVVEGGKPVPVPDRPVHHLFVFHAVVSDEAVEGRVGAVLRPGRPDSMKTGPVPFPERLRRRPGDVGVPVDPAPPLPRPRKDIAKRHPEAGRADAGFRRLLQAPLPEVTERAAPAVRVPAEPVHDGGDVLPAIPVGPGHRGHAPAVAVRTGREAAPTRPYVDEASPAQVALPPGPIFLLPGRPGPVTIEENGPSASCPGSAAGASPKSPGGMPPEYSRCGGSQPDFAFPGAGRHDGRPEPDPAAVGDARLSTADPGDLDGHPAGPRHHLPLRRGPVAHHAPAPLFVDEVFVAGQQARGPGQRRRAAPLLRPRSPPPAGPVKTPMDVRTVSS